MLVFEGMWGMIMISELIRDSDVIRWLEVK